MKRTAQEYVIISLCVVASLGVSPFLFLRISQENWMMVLVDSIILIGMVVCSVVVIKTRKVEMPSVVLAIFAAIAAIAGIYVNDSNREFWLYPAIIAAYYLLKPKWAFMLTIVMIVVVTPVLFERMPRFDYIALIISVIMTSIFGFLFAQNAENQHSKLSELAVKDQLTSAGNRRALDEKLADLILAQRRSASIVSLILLDIDRFKSINDEYGHIVGDQILVKIASIISERIRETDALYRFGGEEFVIVPLEIELESAREFAEQLRALVEKHEFIPKQTITVSFGVAQYIKEESCESWLARADEALYRAKKSGRNCVCVAE